jgi:hypothetical protein
MVISAIKIKLSAFLGAFLLSAVCQATPIFITNNSFETFPLTGLIPCGPGLTGCSYENGTVAGWAVIGGQTGEWHPGPPSGTTTDFNSVPDGTGVAFSNGGSLSQIVAATVQVGATYTLTVEVGARKNTSDPSTEALVIGSGPGSTHAAIGTLPLLHSGNWSAFTVIYVGTIADAGKPIEILLTSGGIQANWDNVALDVEAPVVQGVPEPATTLLVGLGLVVAGVVTRVRKRA